MIDLNLLYILSMYLIFCVFVGDDMFLLKSDLYLQMTLLRHKADTGDFAPEFPKANYYKRPGNLYFF